MPARAAFDGRRHAGRIGAGYIKRGRGRHKEEEDASARETGDRARAWGLGR